MNLIWATSVSAGALHAAWTASLGRTLIDSTLADAIRQPTEALAAAIAGLGCPAEVVWTHLLPLAARQFAAADSLDRRAPGFQSADLETACRELAIRTLEKIEAPASPRVVDRLGLALAQLHSVFVAAQPRLADELPLRVEPLRGQWEARGPGLLFGVRRLSDRDGLAQSANVVLLSPVLGGAGHAHPNYNTVTFEAVLANPIAQLPEVLRLGWLLSQLNPTLSSGAPGSDGWRRAVPWALLAVVLAAAEDVELARADRAHFRLAGAEWLHDEAAADTVWHWWETRAALRPGWLAGLEALARLLAPDR